LDRFFVNPTGIPHTSYTRDLQGLLQEVTLLVATSDIAAAVTLLVDLMERNNVFSKEGPERAAVFWEELRQERKPRRYKKAYASAEKKLKTAPKRVTPWQQQQPASTHGGSSRPGWLPAEQFNKLTAEEKKELRRLHKKASA
jgi:hypothetical protein